MCSALPSPSVNLHGQLIQTPSSSLGNWGDHLPLYLLGVVTHGAASALFLLPMRDTGPQRYNMSWHFYSLTYLSLTGAWHGACCGKQTTFPSNTFISAVLGVWCAALKEAYCRCLASTWAAVAKRLPPERLQGGWGLPRPGLVRGTPFEGSAIRLFRCCFKAGELSK